MYEFDYRHAMRTPWGPADRVERLADGHVKSVSTPRHGGYLVDRSWATKNLSVPAQKAGEPWGPYLAYEEDCQWAVLIHEHPELAGGNHKMVEAAEHSIRFWNPVYCAAMGIAPDRDSLQRRIESAEHTVASWSKDNTQPARTKAYWLERAERDLAELRAALPRAM